MLVAEARQPGDVLATGEFGRARSHELERTLRVVRVPFSEGLALKRDLWLAKPEARSRKRSNAGHDRARSRVPAGSAP